MVWFRSNKTIADLTPEDVHKDALRLIPTPRLVDILVASLDKLSVDQVVRYAETLQIVLRSIANDVRTPTKQYTVRFGRPKEIGLSFGEEERNKLSGSMPKLCALLKVDNPAVQEPVTELIAALKHPEARDGMGALLLELSESGLYRDLRRWETIRNLCFYFCAVPNGEVAGPLLTVCRGLFDDGKVDFELATTGLLTAFMYALGSSAEARPNERVVALMREILGRISLGGDAARNAEYWLRRLGANH